MEAKDNVKAVEEVEAAVEAVETVAEEVVEEVVEVEKKVAKKVVLKKKTEVATKEEKKDEPAEDFQEAIAELSGMDKSVFATQDEVNSGMRYFEVEYNGETLTLSIRRPSAKDVEKGDWEYSKYFNKAVSQNIIPQAAMLEILKENGTWTNEDEKEIELLSDDMVKLEVELKKINEETRDIKRLNEVRDALRECRSQIQEKRSKKQGYLFHTAETKCDERKTRVIVALVTEYGNGPKKGLNFFRDHNKNKTLAKKYSGGQNSVLEFESLQAFDDQNLVVTCYINYLTLINGLAADFLDREMPEDIIYDWES